MSDGKFLKYGRVNPGQNANVHPVPVAASQAFKAKSGRFVFLSSGKATLCDDDSQTIHGWANWHENTPAVDTIIPVETDLTAVYRLPIGGSTDFTVAMRGQKYDLDISAAGIQGVDLGASTHDLVVVVNGDLDNQEWVDVMLNPEELGT